MRNVFALLVATSVLLVGCSEGAVPAPATAPVAATPASSAPTTAPLWLTQLRNGTPAEKEAVLDAFMNNPRDDQVDAVIEAILDNTNMPKHIDTGWGRLYHQAATAMGKFAATIDGKTIEQRGRRDFSFYDDAGTADAARRQAVHDRWQAWWREHRDTIR